MTQSQRPPTPGNDCVAPVGQETELPCRLDRWEAVSLASRGPLARIYRGRPLGPAPAGATYALKVLEDRWQDDPRAVECFRREALVGRTVSHRHLVSVLASCVRRSPRYLVMPWLEGQTLAARLAAGWRPEIPAALWIARQIAEALDALHLAGWIHADVKPSNIHLSSTMHATLLDLGFARRPSESESVVNRCVVGTCGYVAPEMITSTLRSEASSDVYSLGVVLFEMLSGRLPFEGSDAAELAVQHLRAAPPDLGPLVPGAPHRLVRLVRRMLAKEPLRRPHGARTLIDQFAALEIETFAQRAVA
ncbi:MAG: serine/threonine protein kinase [Planctomycetes bacterium]|nr:serine/threonine protein kinase [Planctomycetota bacterium]